MTRTRAGLCLTVLAGLVLSGCGGADQGSATAQGQLQERPATSSAPPTGSPATASEPSVAPSGAPGLRQESAKSRAVPPAPGSSAGTSKVTSASTPRPKPRRSTTAPIPPGTYLEYAAWSANRADYSSGDVVLFFHASWCPKCRDTDASAKGGMPPGLTLVKVDYDGATDVRQKYGVTLQHTFVQIDDSGKALKKWIGTYDDNSVAWVKAQTI